MKHPQLNLEPRGGAHRVSIGTVDTQKAAVLLLQAAIDVIPYDMSSVDIVGNGQVRKKLIPYLNRHASFMPTFWQNFGPSSRSLLMTIQTKHDDPMTLLTLSQKRPGYIHVMKDIGLISLSSTIMLVEAANVLLRANQ